jgi:hypothetical protein
MLMDDGRCERCASFSASLGGRQWQRKYLEGTGIFAFQFRVSHEFDLPFHPIGRVSKCDRRGGRVQTLFDDCDRRSVTGDVHFVEATRGIFREQKDIAANQAKPICTIQWLTPPALDCATPDYLYYSYRLNTRIGSMMRRIAISVQ